MVAKYLRRVVKDGQDLEAREGMAWADTCGGLAIANAGRYPASRRGNDHQRPLPPDYAR